MGELNQHDLNRFGCNIFIETGTGQAVGLSYAVSFPFKKLYSIEIIPELHTYSKNLVKSARAELILGESVEVLNQILSTINPEDRILFWLDAHFPGVDYGVRERKYVYTEENMPLNRELATIRSCRGNCKDTLIIDDLRFYEDGIYELGNIDIGKPKSGLGFIEELFGQTHNISRDYRHQGFIILEPK